MTRRITLDFYNNTADVSIDGISHTFDDAESFAEQTGFDFPDAKIVCCEMDRNLYVIERAGGTTTHGADQPEMLWIFDNIESIKHKAATAHEQRVLDQLPTWNDGRLSLLQSTDWMVIRHSDEKALAISTSLSDAQYIELLLYRQSLRDAGESTGLPTPPSFLSWD